MSGWANLTLVTDADLAAIEPQARANTSPAPWGATTWPTARAEAKRELKILVECAFPKVRGAADRILDRHSPAYVLSYVSGAYADITSAAVDDEEDDVNLTAIFASSANRLYVGADYQFDGIWVKLKDALNAQSRTLTAKYRGGTGWTTLAATDGTTAFASSGRITWTIPSAWQRVRLGPTADEYFWVELSLDAALTSGSTLASQILPIRAPDGLKRVATLLALYYVLNGLERGAGRPEEWKEKADRYRKEALDLFQLLKEGGGIPLDTNRDEVVDQRELEDYTPITLRRG
jgi:hypothetical protein